MDFVFDESTVNIKMEKKIIFARRGSAKQVLMSMILILTIALPMVQKFSSTKDKMFNMQEHLFLMRQLKKKLKTSEAYMPIIQKCFSLKIDISTWDIAHILNCS